MKIWGYFVKKLKGKCGKTFKKRIFCMKAKKTSNHGNHGKKIWPCNNHKNTKF
jgi:hypothetical protein